MEIHIRRWALSDYDGLSALFLQVHELHQENRPDIYRKADTPFSYSAFETVINDRNSLSLLAEAGPTIVAFSLVTLRQPPENPLLVPRRVAYMEDLAVHEDYRSQGIGKRLFEATEKAVRGAGFDSLELMVWNFNREAMEFYKTCGMRPRSTIMEVQL